MGEMANQGSDTLMAVTNFINSRGRHLDELLRNLGHILQTRAATADMRALGSYIKSGNPMVLVTVDDRIIDDLKERLHNERIGFLGGDIEGPESVLFVPTKDEDRLKEIEEELLREKGFNVVQMNIEELNQSVKASAIAKGKDVEGCRIYEIRGLSEEEALSLKNKCQGITSNFVIGIDMENNGECNLAVSGNRVFSFSPDVRDFAKAYLDSTIFLYGARNEDKYDRLVSQKDFLSSLPKETDVKRGEDHKYIYGKQNNSRYIEIDESDFKVYNYASKDKDTITRDLVDQVMKDDPSYMDKLTGYCIGLQECEIGDMADLTAHCQKNDYSFDYKQQLRIELKERKLADKINEIVKTKMAKDPHFKYQMDKSILLNEYIEQSKQILDALANNTNPYGITKDQADSLYDYMLEANLDLADYRDCKQILDRFDVDAYKVGEREKYFEKKYEKSQSKSYEHGKSIDNRPSPAEYDEHRHGE